MTETRAEKAQRLVDEKRIGIVGQSEYGVAAYVKGDHDIYTVNVFPTGRFWCECSWGAHHSFTDDLCAHAEALKLMTEKDNKL